MNDVYSTDLAALGLDYPIGMSAMDVIHLRIPRPEPVLTAQQRYSAASEEKKRKDKARDRSAEYAEKRDLRAFKKNPISFDPNPAAAAAKTACLVGKSNSARSQ